MAFEVGSVSGRLGFKVDETGANRFERKLNELRGKAKTPITADARVDVDRRGFNEYDRSVRQAEASSGRAEKAARSHGSALAGLGKTAAFVAGPFAMYGLVSATRSAFDAYKESERVGRQTNAVLKSTGGAAGVSAKQVNDLANSISRKTGIDDEAIQSGENLLLTFTNIKNEAGKGNDIFNQTTSIMTDMSAALGQDTKASAIQLGKALNDPVKGVTALQRVGVSFTKSQKDQIKGLVEHGKTLDAQKLILRELNKEFGGSAAATATSSKKLGVTLGNLAESIGKAVSPVLEKVAKGLDGFVNGMLEGTGAGGKFVAIVKGIGSAIGGAVSLVSGFVKTFVGGFRDGGAAAGGLSRNLGELWASVKTTFSAIVSAVRGAMQGARKELRGIQPDLIIIGNAVATFARGVLAVFRMILPYVKTVWTGVARVIRGVVEVIAGLLTLNFGKIADGFKRILGGILTAVKGLAGEITAPFRAALAAIGKIVGNGIDDVVGWFKRLPGRAVGALGSLGKSIAGVGRDALHAMGQAVSAGLSGIVNYYVRLPGRIAGALGGLAGLLGGIGRRAVGAFGHALSGLPGAIGAALKGGGAFLGDIGRSIANWLNAHTPLGDKVKIGPLSVRLPALRRGGRPGNVGPSHGGARAFIAGEGSLDEWVISQEGDRRQNVAWAREALEELTGRRVELHKGGKGAKKKGPLKPILSAGKQGNIKRGIGRGEAGIKNFERDIARLERQYEQKDREYGLSEEEFVIEHDDGTAELDTGAINARLKELGSLHALRQGVADKITAYKTAVGNLITTYGKAKARVSKALARAKGSKRQKERGGYRDQIQAYQTRINELNDVAKDLDLDLEDQRLDLVELEGEQSDLSPEHRNELLPPAPPAEPPPADTPDDSPDDSPAPSSDTSSSPTGDATPTAPSAEEVAAAAIAQVTAFNAAREELFGSYGANFMPAGARAMGPAGLAAGARYFGAGSDYAGAGGAGGTNVTQIISFPTPPSDPHGWTAASLHELQAAI